MMTKGKKKYWSVKKKREKMSKSLKRWEKMYEKMRRKKNIMTRGTIDTGQGKKKQEYERIKNS